MRFTTTVKLVVAGSSAPLPNVKVSLYDRDRITPDDHLGTGQTDTRGEIRFDYTTEQFADIDDKVFGGDMPELYVKVFDGSGSEVYSTRSEAEENLPRKSITVEVPQEIAQRLGRA